MGKKKKKKQYKTYATRRDMLLDQYPEAVLDLWFGDDEKKRQEFGDYLMEEYELAEMDRNMELLGQTSFDEDIRKLELRDHSSYEDLMRDLYKINQIKHNKKSLKKYNKLRSKKDLGLATYMNGSRYSKKFLNKNKYRKELKKIAKNEKREYKEMRKLGYIQNKNVDDELNKLKKANKLMEHALSDAYSQKYFL